MNNRRGLLIRVALIPVFVAFCYLFDWRWLRLFTTDVLVWISAPLHIPMHRLGWDLIALGSIQVQFIIACTMIDAYFGAVPLLWRTTLSLPRNLLRLASLFAGVFLLNIARLEIGFVGLHHGLPWWLAHECVAGVGYFILFMYLVHDWRRHETNVSSEPHFLLNP